MGQEIRFEGAGVSPGIARGTVHVVRDDLDDVARYRIAPSQIADEIGRAPAKHQAIVVAYRPNGFQIA